MPKIFYKFPDLQSFKSWYFESLFNKLKIEENTTEYDFLKDLLEKLLNQMTWKTIKSNGGAKLRLSKFIRFVENRLRLSTSVIRERSSRVDLTAAQIGILACELRENGIIHKDLGTHELARLFEQLTGLSFSRLKKAITYINALDHEDCIKFKSEIAGKKYGNLEKIILELENIIKRIKFDIESDKSGY